MRKIFFLLSVFTLLIFAITNCDDTGTNIDETDITKTDTIPTDTTPKNPFVGTWYEVGSTYKSGRKVVFTDTTVIAYRYYNSPNEIWLKWFDDERYSLNNDTLEIWYNFPAAGFLPHDALKRYFIYHSNDTMEIQFFIFNVTHNGGPNRQFLDIILYKSDGELPKDTTQKNNLLIGEWYEVGYTDTEWSRKVVFTETTVTAGYLGTEGTINRRWFDDDRYLFNNDTLEIENPGNILGILKPWPFKTLVTFHSNDTLEMDLFINTGSGGYGIPFPGNFMPITIYRR